MKNPFRTPELRAMWDKCIELAADNFSEFYYAGSKMGGPRWPRRGAGHRCAFWDGYQGKRSLYDGTRGMKGSYGYAAYRAGVDLRKAHSASSAIRPLVSS